MTVKAGQKCTAIRRALVPSVLADAVTDAVSARLAAIVVGHPADPATTMGPLASLSQRKEVRQEVAKLAAVGWMAYGQPSASSSSTATTPVSPPGTGSPCPSSCTADLAGPGAEPSSAACAPCTTTCSAPPSKDTPILARLG